MHFTFACQILCQKINLSVSGELYWGYLEQLSLEKFKSIAFSDFGGATQVYFSD